jgi:hypothetical protein
MAPSKATPKGAKGAVRGSAKKSVKKEPASSAASSVARTLVYSLKNKKGGRQLEVVVQLPRSTPDSVLNVEADEKGLQVNTGKWGGGYAVAFEWPDPYAGKVRAGKEIEVRAACGGACAPSLCISPFGRRVHAVVNQMRGAGLRQRDEHSTHTKPAVPSHTRTTLTRTLTTHTRTHTHKHRSRRNYSQVDYNYCLTLKSPTVATRVLLRARKQQGMMTRRSAQPAKSAGAMSRGPTRRSERRYLWVYVVSTYLYMKEKIVCGGGCVWSLCEYIPTPDTSFMGALTLNCHRQRKRSRQIK